MTSCCALMLSAIGLFIFSLLRQLENFAVVMNFVVFPVFLLSSALYPLCKMHEANACLYWISTINPFTYAFELLRFSMYQQSNINALLIVTMATFSFIIAAIAGYNPRSGLLGRKNA